jgi:cobyrinic acid a,c-diamide synthase
MPGGRNAETPPLPPPGQRIAVAGDEAFSFAYEHVLAGWRREGAEIACFSPLADEAPDGNAVFLPGGYPELHAGRIAAAGNFLAALRSHEGPLYGECGGYMVLGEGLVDAEGRRHAMAGLLPLETSFAKPARRLGYRRLEAGEGFPLGRVFRGHEFHYARALREGPGEPLFEASDALGRPLGPAGLRRGRVAGSFMHLIDAA